MGSSVMRRVALILTFADFALRYWLLAFPHARRAVERCARCADAMPEQLLRHAAVETIAHERGNLEGAAAFAAYTPRRSRRAAIEAVVSFQAMFDYADTLAEQPAPDPAANARSVHQALLDALSSVGTLSDYYAHGLGRDDGGYLVGLVSRCRAALADLPSYPVIRKPLRRAVRRMVDYQTLIHAPGAHSTGSLAAWARGETPAGSGLRWWETAAAGASSLVAFALIAAAASPQLSIAEAEAIEAAYFPWYGSLHVLLDSLVDLPQDGATGHRSLVAHYGTAEEAASRMETIGYAAVASAQALPRARRHALVLASMAGFYLAKPSARLPHAAEARRRLVAVLGDVAWPVLIVHRTRAAVARVAGSRRPSGAPTIQE